MSGCRGNEQVFKGGNYLREGHHVIVSQDKGTSIRIRRPKNTVVLVPETPKMVPLILGNSRVFLTLPTPGIWPSSETRGFW